MYSYEYSLPFRDCGNFCYYPAKINVAVSVISIILLLLLIYLQNFKTHNPSAQSTESEAERKRRDSMKRYILRKDKYPTAFHFLKAK